jgi:arylsulfatase
VGWKTQAFMTLGLSVLPFSLPAHAQTAEKPNILVIMGDDVGYWNISAYNRGMMGYRTPNIDRIAKEGALFTDYYAQQSCTAGRAAFITGQSPIRTGLLKVGLPSAKEGLSAKDPTLAELLKPEGYVTGQFGKNHLGDRNEFLPTVHGFDEFFGNLYHLNAGEPGLSEEPRVQGAFRPARRDEMHCDRHVDPRRRPALWALGQAKMRGHRTAHEEADGDGGRGIPWRFAQFHGPGA